ILRDLNTILAENAYLTIVVQNMRDIDGRLRPIAWDLALELSKVYDLRQEMIWCQDNKKLGCWGYPTTYVSNVHHHYCIILQKKSNR
ncbi:MAG: site-specific DNA-methyltransferase, partial [Candidatus Thorarchaeota archaeon]